MGHSWHFFPSSFSSLLEDVILCIKFTHIPKGTWHASQPPSSSFTNASVISFTLREVVSSMLLLEYETNNYNRDPLSPNALS